MRTSSNFPATVVGRPSIYSVPVGVDPSDANNWQEIHAGVNTICVGMYDSMHNMLMRNFDDWQPTTITTGFGGDWDQAATANQGSRQPPAFTDAAVRKPIYRAPIVQVVPGLDRRLCYIAIVRPEDGNTDIADATKPYINELGLLANNGTRLAHYVTPIATGQVYATRYAKSQVEWLVIKWEIEFAGVAP